MTHSASQPKTPGVLITVKGNVHKEKLSTYSNKQKPPTI